MKATTMVKTLLWGQAAFWGNIFIGGADEGFVNVVSVWVVIIASVVLAFNLNKLEDKKDFLNKSIKEVKNGK